MKTKQIQGSKYHGMQEIKCIKDCTIDMSFGTGKQKEETAKLYNMSFKAGEVYPCVEYYIQLVVYNKEKTNSIAFSMPFENDHVLDNFEYVMNMKFLKSFERQ
jgi:hypothetical protein